jgi:hypothetical protein
MHNSPSPSQRHIVIPDMQVRPGVPLDHACWAAQAIVEYKPDVVVILGDLWDLPSLSSYDAPGSIRLEGARIAEDIEAGNEAFQRLVGPMQKEVKRQATRKLKTRWTPDCHFLMGNHENRIDRQVAGNAKYEGVLSTDDLKTPGFKRKGRVAPGGRVIQRPSERATNGRWFVGAACYASGRDGGAAGLPRKGHNCRVRL